MTAADEASHYRVVAASGIVIVAGSMPGVLSGGLGVQIREAFDVSASTFGLAMSLSALTVGLASGGAGLLLDRYGWHRAVQWGTLASGVALLGIALSGAFALYIAFLLVGAGGMAVALPTSNVLLVARVPADRLGLAMGIKQTAGSWSALYAGLALPLVAIPLGWRSVYVIAVAFPLSALVLAPRDSRSDHETTPSTEAVPQAAFSEGPSRSRLVLIGGIGMIASQAVLAFLVISLVEFSLTEESAGVALATGGVVSIVAQVGTGWLADRREGRGLSSVSVLLAATTVGLLSMATRQPQVAWLGGALAFGSSRGWQGQFFYAVVRGSRDSPGAATGITVMGMGAGAAVGPALFGLVADNANYTAAWLAIAALTGLGVVLARVGSRLEPPTAART